MSVTICLALFGLVIGSFQYVNWKRNGANVIGPLVILCASILLGLSAGETLGVPEGTGSLAVYFFVGGNLLAALSYRRRRNG